MTRSSRQEAVLTPTGPLLGRSEGETLQRQAKALADRGFKRLTIDLSCIQWMNGPGLRSLKAIQISWQTQGQQAKLKALPQQLKAAPLKRTG